jgi:hypothetical protein
LAGACLDLGKAQIGVLSGMPVRPECYKSAA